MAAMAPMQQYAMAMAENRMRDQMGQQQGGGDIEAAMAAMMAKGAGKTVVGKAKKAKAKGKK